MWKCYINVYLTAAKYFNNDEGNTEIALRWNEDEGFAFACSIKFTLKYKVILWPGETNRSVADF